MKTYKYLLICYSYIYYYSTIRVINHPQILRDDTHHNIQERKKERKNKCMSEENSVDVYILTITVNSCN